LEPALVLILTLANAAKRRLLGRFADGIDQSPLTPLTRRLHLDNELAISIEQWSLS